MNRKLIGDCVAVLALWLLLELPHRLEWINLQAFLFLPLEALLFGYLLLLPGRWGQVGRVTVALVLVVALVFVIGDLVVYQVFARPFNPVFDLYLIDDGLRVVSGVFSRWHAVVLGLMLILLLALVLGLSFLLFGRVQRLLLLAPRRSLIALSGLLALWLLLAALGVVRANYFFTDELVTHVRDIVTDVADHRRFAATVNDNPYAGVDPASLFSRLHGKDVMVVFVEAYGRTVFDDPEHAADITPLLERATFQLGINGQQARSAWLASPTVGGLSWLAHGTLLSGLWIDNQARYDTLLMSQRPTLNTLFRQAGWRTVGVLPQIIQPWPEGRYFGFDQLYNAAGLAYQGLPFGWVSMPDQYVLAKFQASERERGQRPNIMAEIVLISSHTPWAPLPQVLRWNEIDEGHVFDAQAKAGPDVDAVWDDPAQIRAQYRKSIAYDLNTLVSYAINYGGDNLVMLVVGDHQPLPIASHYSSSREVPVHVITGDQAVLDAIAEWQWSEGLVPAATAPVWRMDQLREHFVQAMSKP